MRSLDAASSIEQDPSGTRKDTGRLVDVGAPIVAFTFGGGRLVRPGLFTESAGDERHRS